MQEATGKLQGCGHDALFKGVSSDGDELCLKSRKRPDLNTVARTDSTVCICSLFYLFVPITIPNVMAVGLCMKKLLTS